MVVLQSSSTRTLFSALAMALFTAAAQAQECNAGDVEIAQTASHIRCKSLKWWPSPPPGSVADQLLRNYKGLRKLYPLYSGGEVDDKRVTDFLVVVGIADLKRSYSLDELQRAHMAILQCRNMQHGCDTQDHNLAAADHYLNMRKEGLQWGDSSIRGAPEQYYLGKVALFKIGQQKRLQETPNPVSSPNRAVVEWGNRGVEDGLRDYKAYTGREPKSGDRLSRLRKKWVFGQY